MDRNTDVRSLEIYDIFDYNDEFVPSRRIHSRWPWTNQQVQGFQCEELNLDQGDRLV